MTRSILATVAVAIALAAVSGTGCQSTGVGDPCVPEAEYKASFAQFQLGEVNIEDKSFQCQTRLCLVNHFQGRVSCPYGQQSNGMGYPPATGCFVPGTRTPIDGLDPVTHQPIDPTPKTGLASVLPQCSGRQTDQAVYCSCRCANVNGQTNDGANYCTCPDGFQCTQLVTSISDVLDTGLTGGYCIKNNTQYDTNLVGPGCAECDPGSGNCGPVSK